MYSTEVISAYSVYFKCINIISYFKISDKIPDFCCAHCRKLQKYARIIMLRRIYYHYLTFTQK